MTVSNDFETFVSKDILGKKIKNNIYFHIVDKNKMTLNINPY
jgi:hypothetical protein